MARIASSCPACASHAWCCLLAPRMVRALLCCASWWMMNIVSSSFVVSAFLQTPFICTLTLGALPLYPAQQKMPVLLVEDEVIQKEIQLKILGFSQFEILSFSHYKRKEVPVIHNCSGATVELFTPTETEAMMKRSIDLVGCLCMPRLLVFCNSSAKPEARVAEAAAMIK